jgi:hypothetical protein
MAMGACVKIDGGAAELSWSLRDQGGDSIDSCATARIDAIRLCWTALEDGGSSVPQCRPPDFDQFRCDDLSGVTRFEIEPGPTSLFIQPICPNGDPAAIGSYEVPPPIVRTVDDGRVVTLNSLLVVVKRTNCCVDPGDMSCQICTCR